VEPAAFAAFLLIALAMTLLGLKYEQEADTVHLNEACAGLRKNRDVPAPRRRGRGANPSGWGKYLPFDSFSVIMCMCSAANYYA
jgi:hypothetical protein